jgi:hypothetical protein
MSHSVTLGMYGMQNITPTILYYKRLKGVVIVVVVVVVGVVGVYHK